MIKPSAVLLVVLFFCFLFFTDIDECLSTPCLNGGSCKNFVNGYACDPSDCEGECIGNGLLRITGSARRVRWSRYPTFCLNMPLSSRNVGC